MERYDWWCGKKLHLDKEDYADCSCYATKAKVMFPASGASDLGDQPLFLKASDTQVGGDHYKSLSIQPIEYITKNNLGWCEGNIVKYITRWKQKGGKADIDKVIHYANLLKEMN